MSIEKESPKNADKYKVVDLFAGAGGFGLGFTLSGFDVICSVERDHWACDTLRANDSTSNVIQSDIRDLKLHTSIKSIVPERIDVVIGGPPCQGFSVAGPSRKDPKDPRNSLFIDYSRWVDCLRPQVFVMENVRGLLSRRNVDGVEVINIIRRVFFEIGYEIEIWELNAAEYGVPQFRERIFLVGTPTGSGNLICPAPTHKIASSARNGDGHEFDLPKAITLWQALSDLPNLGPGDGQEDQIYTKLPRTDYQRHMRGESMRLYNHVAMAHTKRMVERFKRIRWHQSGKDVANEFKARKRNGDVNSIGSTYYQNNRRLHPHRPSKTIPAHYYSSFVHPFQHRNLTAREGARLQSFPDNYRFFGKRTVLSKKLLEREGRNDETFLSQYNQIGNAVPPLLARAIALQVLDYLNSTNQFNFE